MQLTRLSQAKWTVQINVPEKEPEAASVTPVQENAHQQCAVQSNNVPEKEPKQAPAAPIQPNVHVNESAQTSKPSVQSTVQPLMPTEPKAGSAQIVNKESVFIKTELPDYWEDITIIHDSDDDDADTVDLCSSDDEDIIHICD